MKKALLPSAGFGTWRFQAEKPANTVPTINKEFYQDDTRMYQCGDGKQYVADAYDKVFTFKKGKVLQEHKPLPRY
jgi:hypothetical protein